MLYRKRLRTWDCPEMIMMPTVRCITARFMALAMYVQCHVVPVVFQAELYPFSRVCTALLCMDHRSKQISVVQGHQINCLALFGPCSTIGDKLRTPTLLVPYSITGATECLYTVCSLYYYRDELRTPTLFVPYIPRAKTLKLHSFI